MPGRRRWPLSMLDQILADPADDALRMVYADQLQARGDPRGEYIAVELRLAAAAPGSAERAALARRREELRAAYAAEWWPELPELRVGTRRGFAQAIAVYGAELGLVAQIAAREPLAALELLDGVKAWPDDAPWQPRIRRLVVHTAGHNARFLDSALGNAIEELVLAFWSSWLPISGDLLPRCRRLCVAGMHLADDFHEGRVVRSPLRGLARWQHLHRLEVLDLSHCQIQGPGIGAVTALELPALRVLRLSGNPLGPVAAAALAERLRALPALERLELLDTGLRAPEVARLRGGTRARIVVDEPPPDRLVLDAVGGELELARVNESEWSISLDGERKPIRLRRRGPQREAIDTMVERAVLGRVVRALWTGAPRRFVPDGDLVVPVAGPGYAEARFAIPRTRSEVRYEPWGPL